MSESQENIADVPVPTRSRRSLASSRAWWVAGVYAVFATLWIYLSDHALAWIVQDPDLFLTWSVYKGVAFVAVTSLLLLLLIRRAFRSLENALFALRRRDEQRRAAEDALRHLNQTLELKVADRTRELEVALVRAEAADRIKSAFLATMSHELRTPLNSIIGFTGIVLQELAGPLNEEQAKQLGMVRTSARHLLDLINDVLDLSRIEAGQLEVRAESVDLNDVITQVVDTVAPLAADKGLQLRSTVAVDPGVIISDRRRLKQVLLNLVNNAIKFTDEGSVSLDVQRGDDDVTIRVADTGIGVGSEHLEVLFQPFRQIDIGLTRQHEGTGLGLAICRRLVDLMGGTIAVTSERGQGSEFCVRLPIRARG